MMELLRNSFQNSTKLNYTRHWNRFINFLTLHNLQREFPYSPHLVTLFITYLHNKNLKVSSIRSHLTAIAAVHKLFHKADPTSNYVVTRMLKGIENSAQKEYTSKLLPISLNLLEELLVVLPTLLPNFEAKLFRALFLLCYYCCLRVSEIAYCDNSSHTLTLDNFSIKTPPVPPFIKVSFYSYKHSKEPCSIVLPPSSKSVCPVISLLDYISIRGDHAGPLFTLRNKLPVTRKHYVSTLKSVLSKLKVDPARYNTHSFRIGRATDLAKMGEPDHLIKNAGRWRSNAYLKYIRINETTFNTN